MLYREIIAVCSEIHTKHTNKLCGQNVELLARSQILETRLLASNGGRLSSLGPSVRME
jgi:hypothetical protein